MLRFEAILICSSCTTQRLEMLTEETIHCLTMGDSLSLMCSQCHTVTEWGLAEEDRRRRQAEAPAAPQERRTGRERRFYGRVRLHLPIEYKYSVGGLEFSEMTATINISRSGIYFLTSKELRWGMKLMVLLPRTLVPDTKNPVLEGRIVRIDQRSEKPRFGIAVHFEGITLAI